MSTSQILVSIVVAPSVEDNMVDWLLARDEVSGFTSMPVSGHGSSAHSMSLAEQVAGRQRKILFQTHLPEPQALALVEGLKREFKNCGIHYWLVPLVAGGHL